jgi:hypothetical protein
MKATPVVQFGRHMHPNGNRSLQTVATMTVIKQDNVEPRKLSKERRKEISARYWHTLALIECALEYRSTSALRLNPVP